MSKFLFSRPRYFRPVLACSLMSSVGLWSCQTETPMLGNTVLQQSTLPQAASPSATGNIHSAPAVAGTGKVQVTMRFPGMNGFRTQAIQCSNIADVKVRIVGQGLSEILPQSVNHSSGDCFFSATFDQVPEGTARIIEVDAFDASNNRLTGYSMKGLVDVSDAQSSTAELNFRSTAAGMLAQSLLQSQAPTGAALLSGMTQASLQAYADQLIFGAAYDSGTHGENPDYSYTQKHPLLLHYDNLAQYLVSVNGDLNSFPADLSAYSLQAATLMVTNLSLAGSQSISVNDAASSAFDLATPQSGDETQTLTGILPGTWTVNINHGTGSTYNATLSFAPGGTVMVSAGSTPPANAFWTLAANQPPTANTLSFDPDETSSNLHVLGTSHGVYTFDIASNQWSRKNLVAQRILSVRSAGDLSGQVAFAGTEGQGLFKTEDAGTSWVKAVTGNGFDNLSVYDMQRRMNVEVFGQMDFLFAATNDGVVEYFADSQGNPWSKVNLVLNGNSLAGATVSSITEAGFGPGTRLYITVPEGPAAGVYASLNQNPGNGWYKIDGSSPTLAAAKPYRVKADTFGNIFVACKDGSVLSVLGSDVDAALSVQAPAQPDVSEISWTAQSALSAQPTALLFSSTGAVASTVEGVFSNNNPPNSTWNEVPGMASPLPNRQVNFIHNSSGELFDALAFTQGGIAKYFNSDWLANEVSGPATNNGLSGGEITRLLSDGSGVFVGTRYAGVFYNTASSSLRLPTLPSEARKEILDMGKDGSGNLIVLTPSGVYVLNNPTSVGGIWNKMSDFPTDFKATHLVVNPDETNSSIFISSAEEAANTGVLQLDCSSPDCHSLSAANWNVRYTQPTHSLFMLGNVGLYAGVQEGTGNHQVIKSVDNGATWTGLSGVAPLNATQPIDYLYATGTRVLAVSSAAGANGIYTLGTLPLGSNWNNLSGNLFLNATQKVTSVMLNNNQVFLGLNQGGLRTLDIASPAPTWFDFSAGDPGPLGVHSISALAGNTNPASVLYAGTPGFGLYQTNL